MKKHAILKLNSLFLRGGVIFIPMVCFLLNRGFSQTLCDLHGNEAVTLTIGAPINQGQQSITFLSSLYPNGTTLQNQKIQINGILKIDRLLIFDNCRVQLEQGAQLITEGANTVAAGSTNFYTCDKKMWKGIYLKDEGGAVLLNCEIEDAEAALTLDDGASAIVNGTIFDRNHIGIRNGDASLGQTGLNLPFFGNNTFQCSSLPVFRFSSGLDPAFPGWSYAGIYVNKAVAVVSSYGISTFDGMLYGIDAVESDVTVGGCDFRNMIETGSPAFGSVGIRTTRGSLTIEPLLANVKSATFDNNRFCILANASELDINGATFDVDGDAGIGTYNNLNTDFIYIRNDTFHIQPNQPVLNQWGVYAERNSRSGNQASVDISNNVVAIVGNNNNGMPPNAFSQLGLYLRGSNPSLDIAQMNGNFVTATSPGNHLLNAIQVWGGNVPADRYWINGNNVTYTNNMNLPFFRRWAISMLYVPGSNNAIRNNTCLVNNFLGAYCGIHVEDVNNLRLCLNITDNHEQGIHVFGRANAAGIFQNTMDDHRHGFLLQDNANSGMQGFIGTQTRTANRWPGNYTSRAASNSATPNNQNRFIIPMGAVAPVLPVPASPGFAPLNGVGEFGCPPPPPATEELLDDWDRSVANGSGLQSGPQGWEQKRALMLKLLRYPGLLGEDAAVDNFYATNLNSSAGRFAAVDYEFLQAVRLTESQNGQINALAGQRDACREHLLEWDASHPFTVEPFPSLSDAAAARKDMLDALKANWNNRAALKQQYSAQREAAFGQAQQLNAGLTPGGESALCEDNWKTINAIRLNHALGTPPDEAALNQLRNIAAQCPEEAGSSAIIASQMLPREEALAHWPEEQTGLSGNCAQARASRQGGVVTGRPSLSLSPNPVQDVLSVVCPVPAGANWQIRAIHGDIVAEGRFDAAPRVEINLAGLPAGAYLLCLYPEGAAPLTEKFIVVK